MEPGFFLSEKFFCVFSFQLLALLCSVLSSCKDSDAVLSVPYSACRNSAHASTDVIVQCSWMEQLHKAAATWLWGLTSNKVFPDTDFSAVW